jgi:MFS family permease
MAAPLFTSRRPVSGEVHEESTKLYYAPGLDTATGAEPVELAPPDRLSVDTVRISMRRVVAAWGFGAAFFNLVSGVIFVTFVRRIGADERVVGLLFAALPMMSFLQVISAHYLEKTGRRKRQMMTFGLAGRSLWLVIPLVPIFVRNYPEIVSRQQMLPVVIVLVLLASTCHAIISPPFFAWMADLVPARVRPNFFAQRMRVGTLAAMVTALASGFIVDRFPHTDIYCALLLFAGVCGVMDIAFFRGVKEPPVEAPGKEEKAPSMRVTIGEALQDSDVRRFLAFISLLFIGYGLTGAFLWLFATEYLELSKTVTALILNIGPLVGIACSSSFWGVMIKRYGNRPVIRLCSLGLALVPMGYITAQSETWLIMGAITCFSGIMVAGVELTNLNQITGLAPQVPRPTMAAIFSITAGLSMAGASLLGGQLVHALKWVDEMDFTLMGLPIVNYHILWGIALLLRLVNAVFVAPRLREPSATPTLEAVKEVVPEMIQSFAERLSRPVNWRSGV